MYSLPRVYSWGLTW
jgi:hypothetical protein